MDEQGGTPMGPPSSWTLEDASTLGEDLVLSHEIQSVLVNGTGRTSGWSPEE